MDLSYCWICIPASCWNLIFELWVCYNGVITEPHSETLHILYSFTYRNVRNKNCPIPF